MIDLARFDNHLYIDLDGVLADFEQKVREVTGCTAPVGSNTWCLAADIASAKHDFYRFMKPVAGAQQAFKALSFDYEVHILSTAPWNNPNSWSDKRIWVEEHFGQLAHKRLTLTHNKQLFCGRALIDDRTKNGAADFGGELILFGSKNFPDWESITQYLL